MNTRKLAVVAAGLSDPSSTKLLADHLTSATERALGDAGIHAEVTRIDLRPLAHEIANHMLTHAAGAELDAAIKAVGEADAIIAVSPTFTMSYSGLFKSFFDIIEPESIAGAIALLGATGGSNRHSMMIDTAMRPLFSYLKALVVPTGVFAASEDWGSPQGLEHRIERAGRELAELLNGAPRRVAGDPFDADSAGFQSFDQLLGQQDRA